MPVTVITMLCQAIKTSRQRLDEHHRNDRSNNAISCGSSSGSSSSSSGGGMLINTHVPVPYRRVYARLERFRWRVDVTIANGSLAKVRIIPVIRERRSI